MNYEKKVFGLMCGVCIVVALIGCGSKEASTLGTDAIKAQADETGNYIVNGSFEKEDFTGWTITNIDDSTEEIDIYTRETDCFEGLQSLHFYSGSSDVNFTATQALTGLEDGTYKLTGHIQGDAAGDANASIYFYAAVDGEDLVAEATLSGYLNWYTAELEVEVTGGEIEVGISVTTAPGGWGTIDDITLVME